MIALGLELMVRDRHTRQRQFDEVSEINESPKTFVFGLHGKGDIDRRRIDRAGVERGQTRRAFAGDDDLYVLLRLEAKMAYGDS